MILPRINAQKIMALYNYAPNIVNLPPKKYASPSPQ